MQICRDAAAKGIPSGTVSTFQRPLLRLLYLPINDTVIAALPDL